MFDDLDATLAALLADSGAPAELRGAEASFVTPNKDYSPAATTVNLFLYGLQENSDLHSSVPILTPVGHYYLESPPPIRMDCTYLVTTWSSKSGELKVAEEHRLLGASLLWLSQFPTLPDAMLRGTLSDPPQMYRVTTRLGQTKIDENLAHFWSALAIAPRPTFALSVTIAMQASPQIDEVPRTEAVTIDGVSMEHPGLTGRVLDAALTPVPGAAITVVEKNQRTTSDQRGRFAFDELQFGTYTLLIQAQNHPDLQQTVNYRSTGQVHNVHVPTP